MSLQMSLLKRKRGPLGGVRMELSGDEQAVFDVIHSKGNEGVVKTSLKHLLKTLSNVVLNKCVKSLIEKRKIKEEKSAEDKKMYLMAVEFTASTEVSGGDWYWNGDIKREFIDKLKEGCVTLIRKVKASTEEGLRGLVNRSNGFNEEILPKQIKDILETLVLDGVIMKVKSTGSGIYDSIPIGADCYKLSKNPQSAMALMPCGSCPRINLCTPDGAISPITCEYYNQWLNF